MTTATQAPASPEPAKAEDDPEVARITRNMDLLAGGPETDPFA